MNADSAATGSVAFAVVFASMTGVSVAPPSKTRRKYPNKLAARRSSVAPAAFHILSNEDEVSAESRPCIQRRICARSTVGGVPPPSPMGTGGLTGSRPPLSSVPPPLAVTHGGAQSSGAPGGFAIQPSRNPRSIWSCDIPTSTAIMKAIGGVPVLVDDEGEVAVSIIFPPVHSSSGIAARIPNRHAAQHVPHTRTLRRPELACQFSQMADCLSGDSVLSCDVRVTVRSPFRTCQK